MIEDTIRFGNISSVGSESKTSESSETDDKKFIITRSPKDIFYTILFITFGIWILAEFLMRPNIFGELASMCGPLLLVGGVTFVFVSPRNVRKTGALLCLIGSLLACYMFFNLQAMILDLVYVYPLVNALLALLVSIFCLFISLAQLCKSL